MATLMRQEKDYWGIDLSDDVVVKNIIKIKNIFEEVLSKQTAPFAVAIFFEKVKFVDSSGVALLLNFYHRWTKKGKNNSVFLVGPSNEILELFEMANVLTVIKNFQNEEDLKRILSVSK